MSDPNGSIQAEAAGDDAMEDTSKIPGDRLVIATLSVLRTLVMELSRNGVIDRDHFVTLVEQVAAGHRESGDPNNLANAIHAVGQLIAEAPD
jgi:hypothetical protein